MAAIKVALELIGSAEKLHGSAAKGDFLQWHESSPVVHVSPCSSILTISVPTTLVFPPFQVFASLASTL
jgi:hypothetical protein